MGYFPERGGGGGGVLVSDTFKEGEHFYDDIE